MMDDERQEGKSQEKDKQAEAQPKHTSNTGWGSPSSGGAKGGDDAPHKEKDKTTTAINSTTTAVEDDDEPKGRRKNLRDMEEDQETELIMMIPDLDEDESEDITLQVAAAPRNLARRLPSLQQVET
jgi:hypothetical protein